MKTASKKSLLLFLLVIAALHVTAIYFSIYWTAPQFDRIMHILGGAFAALFTIALGMEIYEGKMTRSRALIWALVGAIFIGIFWEVFEYAMGTTFTTSHNYVFDTKMDMAMDVVGAIVAFITSINISRRSKIEDKSNG